MAMITLNDTNFEDTIARHEILVIDFWAEWCGPCKAFAPTFETVAENNRDIGFAKVNIEEATELANAFNIRSIPHIMVMKQQVVIFSDSGVLPVSALEDLVDQARAADVSKLGD